MPISPVTNNVSATNVGEVADRTQLSPNDFIKLFLTQLTHQNPMQPTDSSAILQQMSQIASIQASHDMVKSMADISSNVSASIPNTQLLQAAQLVGHGVEVQSGVSPLVKNGESSLLSGSVMMPGAANDITVTISDPTGKTPLKTISLGNAKSAGLMDFTWDGMVDGKPMDPGYYQISATANVNGQTVPINTAGTFTVKSVALDQQGIIFNVDGLGGTRPGSIIKIL